MTHFPTKIVAPGAIEDIEVVADRDLRLDSWTLNVDGNIAEHFDIVDILIGGISVFPPEDRENEYLFATVFAANSLGGGVTVGMVRAGQTITLRIRNKHETALSLPCWLRHREARR